MLTKAYHPQTNGQAESTNKILKDRLRKLVNDNQDDWDMFLDVVAHSINHTTRRSTKVSPYFILFGTHPRSVQQVIAWFKIVKTMNMEIEKEMYKSMRNNKTDE